MIIGDRWMVLDETTSTQDVAKAQGSKFDVVFTHHQVSGRGRLGRTWHSIKGESCTFSVILHSEKNHPEPWLLGMAVAFCVAEALDAQLQWPNDVVISGKKVAGVLTEIHESIPIIGVGVNLNQKSFPAEIAEIATSTFLSIGKSWQPFPFAEKIIKLCQEMPSIKSWDDLRESWKLRDVTPGKLFKAPNGIITRAVSIEMNGTLLTEHGTFYAADSWLGD